MACRMTSAFLASCLGKKLTPLKDRNTLVNPVCFCAFKPGGMATETRGQGFCTTSAAGTRERSTGGLPCSAYQSASYSAVRAREFTATPAKRQRQLTKVAAEPSYPELEKIANEESDKGGSEELMRVIFREVDTFNLWLWFELYKPATDSDRELLETVLESWFVIGRMGGFNSMNLQVSQEAVAETSFFRYDSEETETASQAVFMDYSDVEIKGKTCRFWVNMGTADEIALDVLINALSVFSREYYHKVLDKRICSYSEERLQGMAFGCRNLGIKQLTVGGVNEDWPVPNKDDQIPIGLEGLQNL